MTDKRQARQGKTRRRITIVGIHYSPEISGNAPYTAGLAQHLAMAGFDVTVVAGIPHYPAWRPDPEHRSVFRKTTHEFGVRVVRHRHYVPRRPTLVRRGLQDLTFMSQVALGRSGRGADLVIGVSPTLGSAALAAMLAHRGGVPLLLVLQDLYGRGARQSGIAGGRAAAGIIERLEGQLVVRAKRVIAVSPSFLPTLCSYGANVADISLIRNWSHVDAPGLEDLPVVRKSLGWSTEDFVVLHAGNMGAKQGLENVIGAAQLLRETNVRIVLMGGGNQRDKLEKLARGVRNIEFIDSVPEEDFPTVLAAADVLLVNERATVIDMSLPSKLTSYWMAGRPVLAAVTTSGATALEIQSAGAGMLVPSGQPALLAEAILQLRDDPGLRESLARTAHLHVLATLTSTAALDAYEEVVRALL